MKTIVKIMTFKLSVLTTLMLCVTANNYASDIEIYKAPNASDGKARIMLNLDNSTSMSGDPSGMKGGPSTISDDFPGVDCPSGKEKYYIDSETKTYGTKSYTFNALYCEMPKATYNGLTGAAKIRVDNLCPSTTSGNRKCYSRLTMLKRSALDVINDVSLGANVKMGLSFFPKHDGSKRIAAGRVDGSDKVTRPVPLAWYNPTTGAICETAPYTGCNDGRDQLSKIIASVDISETNYDEKEVPVAKGYGDAAHGLLTNSDGTILTADQCSGYGIFTLTSGIPDSDDVGYARNKLNSVLRGETGSTILNMVGQCPDGGSGGSAGDGMAWKCVNTAAARLLAGKARINMPVKSVVVSYGSTMTLGLPDLQPYDSKVTTQNTINTNLSNSSVDTKIVNDKRYAAYAGLNGGGGYNSVQDPDALSKTIKDFIADVAKVDIPYMTTGAPTIPQDPLNSALVQNNAYFSQFKPTPNKLTTVGSQLWVGNMKKYRVNNLGRLIGKNNDIIGAAEVKEAVTNDQGQLITGTHDYWAPDVSSDATIAKGDETVWGSELYARMGGVKSQLPLGTSLDSSRVTVENRKLLTNRVVNSTTAVATGSSNLVRINRADWAANDLKRSDIMSLLDLRQLGAVMHSSPLLLSNEGKMTYNATTQKLESSGREDYVLFGSTQGLLHVVKADDYTSTNGGGKEVFAFVPHEMVENQSKAFLTPDPTAGGTANLFYGIDAPWTAYTEYVPKSDGTLTVGTGKVTTGTTTLQGKQLVYGGLRMGGRSYYSLNLSNMNTPALKFHINPTGEGSATNPLGYMGESWSKPKIAWVNWNGARKLVMFVGGGYDAGGTTGKANNGGYESDTYDQTNGIGAGVYMFSADGSDAGNLLWWASNNASETTAATTTSGVIALKDANLKYSVASEIKTADRNNDGLVDHLYFGDLAGQVFRIDLNNKASTIGAFATRSTRIMNMHAASGTSPRFYAAPSFAIFKDSASGNLFAGISIGSGNLSHPLAGYNSGRNQDALYTIYDKDVTRSDLYTASTMNTQDAVVGASGSLAINELTMSNRFQQSAENMTALVAPYTSSAGWYYKLSGGTKIQHEKIFYSPTVIDYDLYVSSYDSSRLGLTGECGGGVQGVSKVQLFCMPFGQCSAADYSNRTVDNYSDDHGPGIQNHAIASGGDGTTRLVGGAIIGNNLNDQYATRIKLISQRWYEK